MASTPADETGQERVSSPESSWASGQGVGPSLVQHGIFVGLVWLGLLPVYVMDYGWPGAAPRPAPSAGGNWITLDLTGILTVGYSLLAVVYSALVTLIFMHARKRQRRMSWAEYIVYAPLAVVLSYLLFMVFVALG